ncbi:MAG: hypothetical protein HeimAB125_22940 [Candidatus Heimdallarchaeota archaeon AB_125]|nr:MAG: hypothetical protein HeimAB125_22940 [Candidatus Heimdallarchaeota archaeon AB_125]
MTDIFDTEIIHTTIIKSSIEKVFDALTTAEGLDSWFTRGAKVDRKVGGEIHFRWGIDRSNITGGIIEDGGPILEVDIPNSFKFQWYPDNPSYATNVHLKFEEDVQGTKVTVKEYGFKNTPEGRKALLGCATGWGEALTLVKFFLEHNVAS